MPDDTPFSPDVGAVAARFRTIGFDLDGTVVDSAPAIAHALNLVLKGAGLGTLDLMQVRAMIGGGLEALLHKAVRHLTGAEPEDPGFATMRDEILAHYAREIVRDTRVYDGLVPALQGLRNAGLRLAVATNKIESLAVQLLEELDLARHFDWIVGGDTLGPHSAKPRPDMLLALAGRCGAPAAFVGDSQYDVKAARAADMPAIVVSFGYPGGDPRTLGADAVIDHFDELIPALARLQELSPQRS